MKDEEPTVSTPNESPAYETQPFRLALSGIKRLKNNAKGIFIITLILGILGLFTYGPNDSGSSDPLTSASASGAAGLQTDVLLPIVAISLVIALAFIGVAIVLWGMFSFTAARLSAGHKVTVSEAFNTALANFGRLLKVALVQFFRLLGWYLLFIIPGIIMQVRYSLSGLLVFAEPELKPGQVVSRSAQLTKGAWWDTFGGMTSFSFLTLGVMQGMTEIGASSVLYRQLKELKESNAPKPPTHPFSYLLLLAPIILISALIAFGVVQGASSQ